MRGQRASLMARNPTSFPQPHTLRLRPLDTAPLPLRVTEHSSRPLVLAPPTGPPPRSARVRTVRPAVTGSRRRVTGSRPLAATARPGVTDRLLLPATPTAPMEPRIPQQLAHIKCFSSEFLHISQMFVLSNIPLSHERRSCRSILWTC